MPPAEGLGLRHQRVQRLRRLIRRSSARASEEAFVLEGFKLLEEALAAGIAIEGIYVTAGTVAPVLDRAYDAGCRIWELAPGVMEKVADAVTPQSVMAVASFLHRPLADLVLSPPLVVCVDLRDPGNAGTVLRSAEAAGMGGVVCCDGAVDVYNPKTVRASAGALFHVPVAVGGDPREVLEEIGRNGVTRLGTVAVGGTPYTDVDFTRPTALILGNEAHGLPPTVEGVLDGQVTIPMVGRSESLNVGMAAAVLCFEAARQRRRAGMHA